jgi:hypothetical protein
LSARGYPFDLEGLGLGRRPENVDGSEALSTQSIGGKGARKAPEVAIDDSLVDDPARASGVPGGDDRGREGKHDRDGRHARQGCPDKEGPPSGRLDVGRIDDGEPPSGQPLLQLAMEDRERQPRRTLVGGVARDRLAKRVG